MCNYWVVFPPENEKDKKKRKSQKDDFEDEIPKRKKKKGQTQYVGVEFLLLVDILTC